MRRTLLTVCLGISSVTYGQEYGPETVGKVDWDYAYVDMNTKCERYYSLYPVSVKCIEDRLYSIRFKVSYVFRGQRRELYLDYIPDENTRVDANGNLEPRNHTVKERY